MATIRVAKRKRFTTVDQETVNDARLSFRARGVLFWLLDKPDDWHTDSTLIAEQGIEGRDAIRTALTELQRFGYLYRDRHQNEAGQWVTTWLVYEVPTPDFQASVIPALDDRPSDFQALNDQRLILKEEQEFSTAFEEPDPDGQDKARDMLSWLRNRSDGAGGGAS